VTATTQAATAGATASEAASTLELYPMPESGEAPLLREIHAAHSTLDVSCYLVQDRRVISALCAAAQRGVQVRVMMEPAACDRADFETVMAQLTQGGVHAQATPPALDADHFVDHAKFICVDGRKLLLGSGNLVKSGLGGSHEATDRDFWLEDTRPESAQEAQGLFNADWDRRSTTGMSFQNLVVTPDNARGRLESLMDGAQRRLWVYNQELTDEGVVRHLLAAKQRGVDVRVLVAAKDPTARRDHNQPSVQALEASGIPVREVDRLHLHAKAILADDTTFIGSQNFTYAGMSQNRELGDIVRDPGVSATLAQIFLADQG
jgi:phosphatidylserine/phosphatidylglycerophosphate/cardiolipin synthase-like enzyme